MIGYLTRKVSIKTQFLISVLLVLLVSGFCFGLATILGYRVIALILLLVVSLIAISFDIYPVLLSAVLSAFIWNFFFIPPRFTFHVSKSEDAILFFMYFIIALISAALTFKIRQAENAARKKEERAHTLKLYDTLLHSLSHEMRTPIATIIAATDNLQSGNEILSHEKREELISEISKASFRLNQQVENLLNMSRLESGFIQPRINWCDLNELVYDTVMKIEENKIDKLISISLDPHLPLVRTDKLMVEQILYNLLNNACQHTPPGTVIKISAALHADLLQLVVEDNGKGFPPEEIPNVFEKFFRLPHSKAGGTGLGLSIVKGFAEALKGSVKLENATNGGAIFTVSIPVEISPLRA